LYAVTQGHTHAQAAWLANQAAGQVVSRYGNRLNASEIGGIQKQYAQHLNA
jgi:sugar/nucleoside kinase (ribokinase family)